jgi:hypothetical protein
MTLLVNVDTTNIHMNENFQIEYAIQDESTAKVLRVEIEVKEYYKLEIRLGLGKRGQLNKVRVRVRVKKIEQDISKSNPYPISSHDTVLT